MVRIHEIALIVTTGRRNVVVILAAVALNVVAAVYLNEGKNARDVLRTSGEPRFRTEDKKCICTRILRAEYSRGFLHEYFTTSKSRSANLYFVLF